MTRFDECLAHILKYEGGYVDHPADRGQATNKGIAQATFDDWNETRNLPLRPVRNILDVDVWMIYRDRYWMACCCEDLPPPLDLVVFDSAVQHGVGRAVKWLQHIVGVVADGQAGPRTLAAVKTFVEPARLAELIDSYMDARAAFYQQIIANNPSQRAFQRGWANRMNHLEDLIHEHHA